MWTNQGSSRSSRMALLVGLGGMAVGIVTGLGVGAQPLYLALAVGAVAVVVYFFANFEQAVLGLLILRSSLDVFSAQQIPAAFAIALDILVLSHVIITLLTGGNVQTDKFWWFFFGWVMLQGLWLVLLPLDALGLDASFFPESIREWIRLFTWTMVYLLVIQLKDKFPPQKVIFFLFLSLIPPITVALLQLFVPSLLPPVLSPFTVSEFGSLASETGPRLKGTIGHANSFAVYLLPFIGLTWWKLGYSQRRWLWGILLGLLVFIVVGTKMLMSLVMLGVFVLILIAPRLSLTNILGGVVLFAVVIGLFASTEFGQQRLISITNTPLLNPDMDISRAILLAAGDNNSFNWRLGQWTYLLNAWHQSPILGYGIGLSIPVAGNQLLPHNDYVRALVEGGIFGLVTFLTFLGGQMVHLLNLMRRAPSGSIQHRLCSILLAVLVSTFVGMCTENIWSCTTFYFYWWAIFSTANWNWNQLQPLDNPTPISTKLKRI